MPASRSPPIGPQLTAAFFPFTTQGIGLQLWRYVGGPWEHVQSFPFERAV